MAPGPGAADPGSDGTLEAASRRASGGGLSRPILSPSPSPLGEGRSEGQFTGLFSMKQRVPSHRGRPWSTISVVNYLVKIDDHDHDHNHTPWDDNSLTTVRFGSRRLRALRRLRAPRLTTLDLGLWTEKKVPISIQPQTRDSSKISFSRILGGRDYLLSRPRSGKRLVVNGCFQQRCDPANQTHLRQGTVRALCSFLSWRPRGIDSEFEPRPGVSENSPGCSPLGYAGRKNLRSPGRGRHSSSHAA